MNKNTWKEVKKMTPCEIAELISDIIDSVIDVK